VSHFAAAITRTDDGWVANELDIAAVEDLDGLTDALRDVVTDTEASTAVLFVEEDDEYLAIVRLDGESEPRVFLSDVRAVDTSSIAAMLYEEAAAESLEEELNGEDDDEDDDDEDEEDGALRAEADPAGDTDLLADLGTPAKVLLDLCAEEGMLPADIITAVCESLGCVEQVEALR
jgi:putative tRNA adenosine deaminase-associated protein